jgi:hypothetical protein
MKPDKVDKELGSMLSGKFGITPRIQAAAWLLKGGAPTDAVKQAVNFLVSVFADRNEHADLRLYAAQVLRNWEAGAVEVHLTHQQELERKEAWRNYEIFDLGRRIRQIARQAPPHGYASHLEEADYVPPLGTDWPPVIVEPEIRVVYDKKVANG